MDRRERLIAVFEDTQAYYTENRRPFFPNHSIRKNAAGEN